MTWFRMVKTTKVSPQSGNCLFPTVHQTLTWMQLMKDTNRMTWRYHWGAILFKVTPNRHCEISKGGIAVRLEAGKIIVQNRTIWKRIVQLSDSEMGLGGPLVSLMPTDVLGPTLITSEILAVAWKEWRG